MPEPGTLYVVATPIGNQEDITLRAIKTLRRVDLILAEDTRRARVLTERYRIRAHVSSCFPGNERQRGLEILEHLAQGRSVAVISEAGTPGLSDPGAQVVAQAVQAGYDICPIPGPSALSAALSASGFPGRMVLFVGFLPRRPGRRLREIESARGTADILVIYENPVRLPGLLRAIEQALGDPEVIVAREMSKIHEEFLRGRASTVLAGLQNRSPKGEVTVLVRLDQEKIEGGEDGEDPHHGRDRVHGSGAE